ncbi:MAG TPA: hypothetical protein VK324_12265 [Tepidisphaeraceae bacterium]|nr:hypothetical protein [Tepidisphaeraceae bacterium]
MRANAPWRRHGLSEASDDVWYARPVLARPMASTVQFDDLPPGTLCTSGGRQWMVTTIPDRRAELGGSWLMWPSYVGGASDLVARSPEKGPSGAASPAPPPPGSDTSAVAGYACRAM